MKETYYYYEPFASTDSQKAKVKFLCRLYIVNILGHWLLRICARVFRTLICDASQAATSSQLRHCLFGFVRQVKGKILDTEIVFEYKYHRLEPSCSAVLVVESGGFCFCLLRKHFITWKIQQKKSRRSSPFIILYPFLLGKYIYLKEAVISTPLAHPAPAQPTLHPPTLHSPTPLHTNPQTTSYFTTNYLPRFIYLPC